MGMPREAYCYGPDGCRHQLHLPAAGQPPSIFGFVVKPVQKLRSFEIRLFFLWSYFDQLGWTIVGLLQWLQSLKRKRMKGEKGLRE